MVFGGDTPIDKASIEGSLSPLQVPAHAKQELSAEIMTSALVCGIIRIYKCPRISIRVKTLEAKLYEKVELIRESSDSGLVEGTCRVSEPPTRLVSSD